MAKKKQLRILKNNKSGSSVYYYPQVKTWLGWQYIQKDLKIQSYVCDTTCMLQEAQSLIRRYVSVVFEGKPDPFGVEVLDVYTWTAKDGLMVLKRD